MKPSDLISVMYAQPFPSRNDCKVAIKKVTLS